MSDVAVRVEHLSKQFRIGVAKTRHDTLRDLLTERFRSLVRRNGRPAVIGQASSADDRADVIWALKDVSFDVKKGEVLGIIGPNGAGKSTLLKILSRITEPTEGRVRLHGRVRSLLEVGTGFHGELTGRENIYLNGAILGMRKAEIESKFDEIVAFAEVDKFIDTPVKRYSSGMYVRLAFSVAAHLEPEILIVDEVLAVGDAVFQKKCLGTMQRSASSGKTVLFVSHNMPSVQQLCTRAILLRSGRIAESGHPSEVIGHYLAGVQEGSRVSVRGWLDRTTSGEALIDEFEVTDDKGDATNTIAFGSGISFSIRAEFHQPLVDPCFGVLVHNTSGEAILDIQSSHAGLRLGKVEGPVRVHASVEKLGLYPGEYLLSPWIADFDCTRNIDWVRFCCTLHVKASEGRHFDQKLDPQWGRYWVASDWTTP